MKKYTSLLRSPRGRWHPIPLRPIFLLTFLVLVLIVIIAIQLLITQPILTGPSFLFDSIPTAVPVVLGLLWAFSAHDYKRLEPFFQLSSPTGALAEDSLLLEYSYMFILSVPVVSLRKGHYAVLLSALIMLLLTSVITPFSSGLFDIVGRIVETPANVPYRDLDPAPFSSAAFAHAEYAYTYLGGSLPSFMTPEYVLTPWVDAGNATSTWRGESRLYESNFACVQPTMEPFEDPELGPAGYNVTNNDGKSALYLYRRGGFSNEDDIILQSTYGNISDGIWFRVNDTLSIAREMKHISGSGEETVLAYLYIIGAADPAQDDDAEEGIKKEAGINMEAGDWTALWCEPTYRQQDVEATVLMPSGQVTSVERTGEPVVLDTAITRRFGDIMLQGSLGKTVDYSNLTLREMGDIPVRFGADTRDLPPVNMLIPGFRAGRRKYRGANKRYESIRALSAHVFIGISDGEPDEIGWRDPKVLAQHYEQRWKEMFAFAVMQEMVAANEGASKSVIITKHITGWRVSPGWGRATQAAFGLLAALVLGLVMMGIWQGGRPIELDGEPNSLSSAMGMLDRSGKGISDLFDGLEYCGLKKVGTSLEQRGLKYGLALVEEVGPRLEILPRGGDRGADVDLCTTPRSPGKENTASKPGLTAGGDPASKSQSLLSSPPPSTVSATTTSKEPRSVQTPLLVSSDSARAGEIDKVEKNWIVHRTVGLFLILFFCSVTGAMVFLYIYDISHQGLPTVYPLNSFGFKVLYSYIPTLLATGIEPIMIALGTYHCMIAPYRRLRHPRNQLDSSMTLSLDFDRSPPQFQLLQAIKSRDVQVGALALAILVVNLLAITFGSLFFVSMEVQTLEVLATVWDMPQDLGMFPELASNAYLSLSATLSNQTGTQYSQDNPQYYIPPMTLSDNQGYDPTEPDVSDQLSRLPVGEMEWNSLVFGSDVRCVLIPQENIHSSCSNGSSTIDCGASLSDISGGFFAEVEITSPGGELSWEKGERASWPLQGMSADAFVHLPSDNGTTFLVGWSEMPADPEPKSDVFPSTQLPRIDTVALYCASSFKVGSVTASLNTTNGVIKTSNVVFPLPYENDNAADGIIYNFHVGISHGEGTNYWDLIDLDRYLVWFNHFMAKLYPNLVRHGPVNETHLPSTDQLAEAFENVYNRMFAQSLQMYSDDIFANVTTRNITAVFRTEEPRVRVSKTMFIVSCAVMSYLILVLLAIYCKPQAEEYYERYLPTNLASMWTLLYASTAKEDCGKLRGNNPDERAKLLAELGNSYSLGEFVGNDGQTHWGVYRAEKRGGSFVDSDR